MLFIQVHQQKNLDVFSFFPMKNAIQCPDDFWFEAICASLKMKHSVLILEDASAPFPPWNEARRFDVSDNCCWLAPRGLGVITEAYRQKPMNFQQFKTFIKKTK
jgi:hypothetical protein